MISLRLYIELLFLNVFFKCQRKIRIRLTRYLYLTHLINPINPSSDNFNHPASTQLKKLPAVLPHFLSASSAFSLLFAFPIIYVYG